MSFIPTRLSTCVAYGFSGGPNFSTLVVEYDNGREQRNQQWLYPKHKYSAQYNNVSKQAQREILAAFHAAGGATARLPVQGLERLRGDRRTVGAGHRD